MNDPLPAGFDQWKTTEPAPSEPDPRIEAEEDRERRWWDFEMACQEFASSERDGWAAVLRAIAGAMKDQRELPPRA